MSFVGRCTECGKGFRVPHDRKEWSCKSCGGVLALEAEEPAEAAAEDGAECPACGAVNPADAAFCEECGANMETGEAPAQKPAPAARKRRKGSRRGHTASSERNRENSEIRDVFQRLRKMRGFITLLCVLAGVTTLRYLVDWYLLSNGQNPLTDDADEGALLLAALLSAVPFAIGLFALRTLYSNPFPAMLAMSAVYTVQVALVFLQTGVPPVVGILVLIFMWKLTLDAMHIKQLFAKYPDNYFAKRNRGELDDGGTRGGRRRVSHKEGLSPLQWFAFGFGGLLTLGILGNAYVQLSAPVAPELEPALEEFAASWNEADPQAIATQVTDQKRASLLGVLERQSTPKRWGDDWPQIEGYRISGGGETRRLVVFDSEAGPILVNFEWSGGSEWELDTFKNFSDIAKWSPDS